MKNRFQFEVQDRVPLVIDFGWILEGFGGQVGRGNRAKIDQKSIQKSIQKIIEKSGRLGRFWGGEAMGAASQSAESWTP